MVRPFGTVGGKRKVGRLGVVGVLLASTALVGLPEVRAAGELLEVTAGWTDYYMFNGSAISGDGTKVVGNGFDLALGDFRPALSTPDGLTRLATLGSFGRVNAISRTGERMVGYVTGPSGRDQAVIWAASGAVETIGTLHPLASTASSQAHDISGDGRRVVGQSLYSGMMRGFVWIEGATGGVADNEEMYQLPGLPASGRHIASAISDNGMFAVGESNGEAHTGRAVRWDLTTIEADGVAGIIDLGYFSGMGGYSSAFDVSADGRVVVGEASDADGLARAFRWVEGATTGVPDNPQMYDLGTLGGDRSWASAVSRNGSWVVGGSMINADESRAFRWSEEHDMESVGDWLARGTASMWATTGWSRPTAYRTMAPWWSATCRGIGRMAGAVPSSPASYRIQARDRGPARASWT